MILEKRTTGMEVWTQRLILGVIVVLCVGHLVLH